MTAIAYYLLKVTIISGILFGYYHLALKDKVFHQWNRFYLLAIVVFSLTMPLVSFPIQTSGENDSRIITALQVVSGADEMVATYKPAPASLITTETLLSIFFIMISMMMMGILCMAITRIIGIARRYDMLRLDDIHFINTREPGTPFSFFNYIFWNEDIDLQTPNGKRIFEHEMVHVREHHSRDKLFLQVILVAGWINPFFWLIRSELNMIHEFIADRKSIGEKDSTAFAELILQTTYPKYNHLLSNPFFQNSIKRRLTMITKSQHPGMNYLSRISALVIATCILLAFTLKPKTSAPVAHLAKKFTVVIDAGHGGTDNGAMGGGLMEKNLSLQIARIIKASNNNPNIDILLTRESDRTIPLPERVQLVADQNADLFISIHTAASDGQNINKTSNTSGFEAYIAQENSVLADQNIRLASIILKNLSGFYKADNIAKRSDKRIYVLDNNTKPAVILECGFITDAKDRSFISDASNQKKIAENILESIEQYFSADVLVNHEASAVDTLPKKSIPSKKDHVSAQNPVAPPGATSASSKVNSVNAVGDSTPAVPPAKVSPVSATSTASLTVAPANVSPVTAASAASPASAPVKTAPVKPVTPSSPSVPPTKAVRKKVNSAASSNIQVESDINTSVNSNVESNINTTVNSNINTAVSTSNNYHQSTNVSTSKNTSNQSVNVKQQQGTINVSSTSPGSQIQIRANQGNMGDSALQLRISGPEPLYVVDGVITTKNAVNSIDPNKISSIDVLKGTEATKQYGDNGKNGVIRIITKN